MIPQQDQTHPNNLWAIADICVSVFDHFVGSGLERLM